MVQIIFIEGKSILVQGKQSEIYQKYGKEWNIREQGKGNGNWLLTKNADIRVNGKSYRDFVLDHYNKCRLTKNLADKFRNDVENGVIKL